LENFPYSTKTISFKGFCRLDLTVNGDETVQPAPFKLDGGVSGPGQAAKVKTYLKMYLSNNNKLLSFKAN
jgi:hypothetical protein